MSEYLKIVHRCIRPEIELDQNIGTFWKCDCGLIWEITMPFHYPAEGVAMTEIRFIWKALDMRRYNKETGEIISTYELTTKILEEYGQNKTPKKWWQR